MALEREMKTYAAHLIELLPEAGRFALIKEDTLEGVYDTYADALRVGYEKFKLDPFLIKQIAPAEKAMAFTRDYEFACLL